MKVYNKEKTKLLDNYDLELGYLEDDILETTCPETVTKQAKGHYEITQVYTDGRKDLKWVVDEPEMEYKTSRTKTENIKIFIPYTKEELNERTISKNTEMDELDVDKMELLYNELYLLIEWFDHYYTKHEQKYRRLIAMDIECDDGRSASEALYYLFLEAEMKRKRIKELRSLVK